MIFIGIGLGHGIVGIWISLAITITSLGIFHIYKFYTLDLNYIIARNQELMKSSKQIIKELKEKEEEDSKLIAEEKLNN